MAYICELNRPCEGCPSYRMDEDRNRMACFAQQDMKQRGYEAVRALSESISPATAEDSPKVEEGTVIYTMVIPRV